MAENNIDDIDKEISFLEQKLQELKSESFNIRYTSLLTKIVSRLLRRLKETRNLETPDLYQVHPM